MKEKPKVGQKLYELYIGHISPDRLKGVLTEVEVLSVGRKYFTAAPSEDRERVFMHRQYLLSTWHEDGKGYSSRYRLYSSPQEYSDEIESARLREEITRLIEHGDHPLEMLQTINRMIQS